MPPIQPPSLVDRAVAVASLARSSFVCSACRHRQQLSTRAIPTRIKNYAKARRRPLQSRSASTTASVTAVNAKREIPLGFQKLHASLKALETDAGIYVNTSQLQLALQGTESENAVTRIAGQGFMQCCQLDLNADARDSAWTQWATRST